MILECHNQDCGNQRRGTCGMHTTDDFRCKDRRALDGRPLDLPLKNKASVILPDGSIRSFQRVKDIWKPEKER